jgi:diguanylate cyclase (GGDEF)-like protein
MPDLTTAAGQTLAAFAAAFVVLALVYSYVKYERLMRLARSGGGGGLSPRDAFLLAIARRLAAGGQNPGGFSVCILRFAARPDGPAAAAVLPLLKKAARRGDDLMALDEHGVGAVLDLAPSCLPLVIGRWRSRLEAAARQPDEPPPPASTFGAASYPADGDTGPGLLDAAGRALAAAEGRAPGHLVGDLPAASPPPAPEPVPPAEAALLDPLTGILRADKMGGAARKFIARCRRDGLAVSVLHIGIDRIEDLTRRVGREAGDAVIRAFGALLSAHVREADLIGRFAGGEFLAVLECTPAGAEIAARRLVDRVRADAATCGTVRVPFAVCIGIAGIGGTGSTPGHVIDAAGTALRRARKQGPNTWVVYDRSMGLHEQPEREMEDVF